MASLHLYLISVGKYVSKNWARQWEMEESDGQARVSSNLLSSSQFKMWIARLLVIGLHYFCTVYIFRAHLSKNANIYSRLLQYILRWLQFGQFMLVLLYWKWFSFREIEAKPSKATTLFLVFLRCGSAEYGFAILRTNTAQDSTAHCSIFRGYLLSDFM